ncbi:helix-turn-helix transcriptional regulator [Frigoribacterium sp. PvP032]|uniref:helix-turn-helix transcriptional regulator n=1 Tax=Frigoribacterium sp. PvP032 TaxID=2806589 RepID=UPI001AE4CC98|nr:helix-turn-helix transcriptional regulator [Frigoribacterium sp. PvP032]MBP1189767.1 AraC-like DNA-binding protein [Frigoribacterium sp. PvP032]
MPDESERLDVPAYSRTVVQGTDLHEVLRSRSDHHGGRRFDARPSGAPFSYRYVTAGDERVTLQTSHFTGHMEGEVPFPDTHFVMWFRSGSATVHRGSDAYHTDGSTPFLIPAEDSFEFEFEPRQSHLVRLGTEFLEQTATELHGGPSQRVAFDVSSTPRAESIADWRSTMAGATEAVVGEVVPPLLRLEAQLSTARAVLRTWRWQVVDVPRSLRTPGTVRVRHALEYLHAHAAEPISPSDVAAAVGLHTRSLQLAMSEHLGTSPSAYLRQVRLDRVRADLLAASPHETTIAAVARRWGFGNLGRFSASYADHVGEYPRDTLAR